LGAFKKLDGRTLYIDLTNIKVPAPNVRAGTKANMAKFRAARKVDPFARTFGSKFKYGTPEELQEACNEYFKSMEYFVTDRYGNVVTDPMTGEPITDTKPLTLSGLGLAIGVRTDCLRRYAAVAKSGTADPRFATVIEDAIQRVESYAEKRLYDNNGARGSQFALQAGFGWNTDKEESEIIKNKVEAQLAQERFKLQKREHELKMKMMELGMDTGEDKDINITITRASKG
jgi:hypothetical protein